MYSYVAWCANSIQPFVNINDIRVDIKPNRHFESTIKYGIWEWSFSIGKTDYTGHGGDKFGSQPHYHLQIKKNGQSFFKYSDAHIPFSNDDLLYFAMMEQDVMRIDPGYGAGLEAMNEENTQKLLTEYLTQAKDESHAPFRTQTIINTDSLSPEIMDEIKFLHDTTEMTAPTIIDKLNREKGYNIQYATRVIPNSSFEKSHREQTRR